MLSEHERITQATLGYEVDIAQDSQMQGVQDFRDRVYNKGGQREAGRDRAENARFALRARHVILTHIDSGNIVGAVRMVPSAGGNSHDLPMEHVCKPDILSKLPLVGTAEIGRFGIMRAGDEDSGASNAMLRFVLLRGLLRASREQAITHWCSIMEPALLRLLRASAIHFHDLGEPIEYRGICQPCSTDINLLLERIRTERPGLHHYFEEQGLARAALAKLAQMAHRAGPDLDVGHSLGQQSPGPASHQPVARVD